MPDSLWRRGQHYRSVQEMQNEHPLFCDCEKSLDLERGKFHGVVVQALTPTRSAQDSRKPLAGTGGIGALD